MNNIFFIVAVVASLVTTLFAFVIGYPDTVSLVTAAPSPSNSSNLPIGKVAATAATAATASVEPSLISSNAGSPSEIGFDTQNMTHRSAQAEWQPHQGQTKTTQEWWYVTALLNDASGNRYLLFNTLFKYDGKDIPTVSSAPELASKLGPNATIISPEIEFSNYNTGLHYYDGDGIITNPINIWNSSNNALIYKTTNYTGSWSYDGNNMNAVLKSPKLSYDLKMQGANQVMWSKDKTYNKEGFLQQGLPGNVSFYYSLPRLFISGNLTYVDQSGANKTIDVTGHGWVDRQWGNFKTEAWEWNSFRFDDGARLNLYNFANAYKVGTYQKPDGSTQWLDNFIIKQNGYSKAPNGQWVALGWSFDFPIDIEGSKHYTVVPFSKGDWICSSPDFCFIEGAGQLVDDTTLKNVGSSIFESMDTRMLNNGPYDINQH